MPRTTKRTGGKKKEKKNVPVGRVYIQATFNNTLVSITDDRGNLIAWSSSGSRGFKGAKKGTAYAAQIATEAALRTAQEHGLREVSIFSQGPGSGKDAAVRTVNNMGFKVSLIKDTTPVPHNGCRPRKRRRV
ncbi:MAG: 30S ribosomal protein S11 [bacterium]